jgi:hypothetical protein
MIAEKIRHQLFLDKPLHVATGRPTLAPEPENAP